MISCSTVLSVAHICSLAVELPIGPSDGTLPSCTKYSLEPDGMVLALNQESKLGGNDAKRTY